MLFGNIRAFFSIYNRIISFRGIQVYILFICFSYAPVCVVQWIPVCLYMPVKAQIIWYIRTATKRQITGSIFRNITCWTSTKDNGSFLNDTLDLNSLQIVRAFLVPREGVWGHFWFLPMIYLCGIIGYTIDKNAKLGIEGWGGITIIAFAVSFLNNGMLAWFGINDLLYYFMFYSFGIFCCQIKVPIVNKYMSIFIVAVCLTISLILFFCINSNAHILHLRNTLIAICMICVILYFCLIIENHISVERNSPIAQTYQIFILSWPCQLIVGIVIERILHLNWMIFITTVFVAGITMPLMILKAVDFIENKSNNKILSFILGR